MDAFDLDAYLGRLGLPRPVRPDEDGLSALHLAHELAIPFENCDVLLGRGVKLDLASLQDKLVRRRRGGYCFEQNGLFLAALHAQGFTARTLLARVMSGMATPSAKTHAVLLVTVGNRRWLADVGFGGTTPRTPLPLEIGREDRQLDASFRLRHDDAWGTVLERRGSSGAWADQYAFTEELVLQADLELGNHYTSTSPRSHFTQRFACARATAEGRVTLSAHTLSVHRRGALESRELAPGPELLRALEEDLGITPDTGFARFAVAGR